MHKMLVDLYENISHFCGQPIACDKSIFTGPEESRSQHAVNKEKWLCNSRKVYIISIGIIMVVQDHISSLNLLHHNIFDEPMTASVIPDVPDYDAQAK